MDHQKSVEKGVSSRISDFPPGGKTKIHVTCHGLRVTN
jgi:hypothetical protein